ncbi:RsfA family transcriptional regulator [Lentibacillus saliphilus]|uniref:RsfA family transcriptional regulator n=1 Tax=Lentibacillus saliphilus TaxID=2737028 RepID=UPI001C300CC8|nr:RsfA family transcriptional regulator [Lentibacillus saliphilus]
MNATRQDAWSRDEDMILAETVLRYIREGKTQLEAFKEVAKQLSRTSAACGFRWNATIRKHYEEAIQQAKQDRKSGLSEQFSKGEQQLEWGDIDPIETAIRMLENMKKGVSLQSTLFKGEEQALIERLKEENDALKQQLNRYDAAWKEMGKLWEWVTDGQTE